MSKVILDEPGAVRVGRRAIRVDGSGAVVEVQVVSAAGSVGRHPTPRSVELPDVAERLVVRVVPIGGGLFPDGAVVTVVVRNSRTDDGDEDTVTVRNVDVAGRPFRDLAALSPVDERTAEVRRLVGADEPLGPVAAQARTAARGLLGFDARDDSADPLDVLVLVDTSASMVAATADGTLEAAVDTVVGAAQVLAPGRTPQVRLGTGSPLDPVAPGEVAGAVVRAAAGAARGSGFRSVPEGPGGPGTTLVYVVTDDVPADVRALREAGGPRRLHRLLLVDPAAGTARTDRLPVAVLPTPPPGATLPEHLARSAAAMTAVVGPMVAGFEPAGARR